MMYFFEKLSKQIALTSYTHILSVQLLGEDKGQKGDSCLCGTQDTLETMFSWVSLSCKGPTLPSNLNKKEDDSLWKQNLEKIC